MSFIAAGVAVVGVGYSIYSSVHQSNLAKKAQKAQTDAINNAPKYQVQDEVYQNKNLAEGQAFGQNRALQMQQQNVSQEASNAGAQARDVSSSTSDLLSTVAAINANKNTTLRGLGQDQAAVQQQNMQTLYGVNNQVIDEQDKAWNYNQNMPYQMKIAALRDQIQTSRELSAKSADNAGSIATSYAGSISKK